MPDPADNAPAPVKGRSLWADAWRRLLKNRMAVGGMVVVAVMGLVSLAAEWIAPFPATYQQLWVDARPPGYTHPELLGEMSLETGRPPEVPARARKASTLRFRIASRRGENYRVVLHGPQVRRITRQDGAEPARRLEVRGRTEALAEARDDGSSGPEVRDVVLEVGEDLPPALGISPPGSNQAWVLLFRRFTDVRDRPIEVRARVEGGSVASVEVDGERRESVAVQARQVISFEADGKPLTRTHWLGTDQAGRDVLSRMIFGGRISLLVGLVATVVSLLIGVVYGAASGYFGEAPVRVLDFLLLLAVVLALLAGHAASGGGAAFWVAASALGLGASAALGFAGFRGVHPYATLQRRLKGGAARFLLAPVIGADNFLMRVVDILYGLPYMFLVILLLVNFGRDIVVLFIALGAVQWLTMARIVRGQVLSLKEKEFIEAARMAGAGHGALLFRHLIPNTLGIVAVYTTLTVPAVILQESFLAFIGLAVQYRGENLASWGALVDEGRQALGTGGDRWWILVFPSLAMAVTLFAMNFLGDGLRDALDPQQKGRT
jgi:ABC-type dipeptide/oligopeptide/nickel transport system permease subunit